MKALQCGIKFLDHIERWLLEGLKAKDIMERTCQDKSNIHKAIKAANERKELREKSVDIATFPMNPSVFYELSKIENPPTKTSTINYIRERYKEQPKGKIGIVSPITVKEIQTKISEFEGKEPKPKKEKINPITHDFKSEPSKEDIKTAMEQWQCKNCGTDLEMLCPKCERPINETIQKGVWDRAKKKIDEKTKSHHYRPKTAKPETIGGEVIQTNCVNPFDTSDQRCVMCNKRRPDCYVDEVRE